MEGKENNLLAAREPLACQMETGNGVFGPKYIGMCNEYELGFKRIYHMTRHCHQLGTLPKGVFCKPQQTNA